MSDPKLEENWIGCPCCGELHVNITVMLEQAHREGAEEAEALAETRREQAIIHMEAANAAEARVKAVEAIRGQQSIQIGEWMQYRDRAEARVKELEAERDMAQREVNRLVEKAEVLRQENERLRAESNEHDDQFNDIAHRLSLANRENEALKVELKRWKDGKEGV